MNDDPPILLWEVLAYLAAGLIIARKSDGNQDEA
jgi:hypothetical protein